MALIGGVGNRRRGPRNGTPVALSTAARSTPTKPTRSKTIFRTTISASAAILAASVLAVPGGDMAHDHGQHDAHHAPITMEEVDAAQAAWGAAIVAIGEAHATGGDYRAVAGEVVDTLYAFHLGPVLFKPTVATAPQFRPDRESALSYFVTGGIEEDKGFALAPWTAVRFENETVHLGGPLAIAMGNYFFTNTAGEEAKVEYTKGYLRGEDGGLLIFLQHSSFPHSHGGE